MNSSRAGRSELPAACPRFDLAPRRGLEGRGAPDDPAAIPARREDDSLAEPPLTVCGDRDQVREGGAGGDNAGNPDEWPGGAGAGRLGAEVEREGEGENPDAGIEAKRFMADLPGYLRITALPLSRTWPSRLNE